MTRTRANLLLLVAGALWGMGFVAQSAGMDDLGPFSFVAWRFVIASIVVAPFALRESRRVGAASAGARGATVSTSPPGGAPPGGGVPLDAARLRRFALVGAMLFLGMATQQVGLLTTSVTNSGFLTGLYVVFTPLFAVALFRERPHRVVWPAALLALAGIALLSGGGVAGPSVGDLLTVASACFWALQVVLIARFGAAGRPLALSLAQFVVTAILAGIVALALEPFDAAALARAAPSVLYAGIVASGVAFTLQVIAQRWTTAPQAAIFLSSEAPFAALFGFLALGERVPPIGFVGAGLILASMLVVELAPMLGRRASRTAGDRARNPV